MLSGRKQQDYFSAAQVRELDRRAIASGIPGLMLMTRAGEAAFAALQERWAQCAAIDVFCGGGNNGGDGYIVAALAAEAGMDVRVWALSDKLQGDALLARQRAEKAGVEIQPWVDEEPGAEAVVVDAMLGTGLSGRLREPYASAIAAVNCAGRPVLSIDIPSGLCSDTGSVLGAAVVAGATVSFIGLKLGLVTGAAVDYVGDLLFDDLGVPPNVYEGLPPLARQVDHNKLLASLGSRPRSAHKGQFGHVLLVAGDHGYAGAAILASSAAARAGAGLTSCATRPENIPSLLAVRPEVMARGVEEPDELVDLLARVTVVAIGPGLGKHAWGLALLRRVLALPVPVVLDADALNLVADHGLSLYSDRAARVITPHPGEAARLLGRSTVEIQADRLASVREMAAQLGATVLLKGAGTLIATDDGVFVNLGGNPGMASGGMGDVLTGIIAALLAQGMEPGSACCLGASVHVMAADRAAAVRGERGLLAMDLVDQLPAVLN